MKSLCFLVAVMLVSVATVSESVEVAKRILPILGGGDELLGGILLGDGGLLSNFVEGEGGILTNFIGGDKGILGGILGLKADVLSGLIKTVVGLISGVVKTLAKVIGDLTKGLEGKTTEPEIYAEFRKYPLKTLCPLCPNIKNQQQAALCQKYCGEQNWRP